MKVPVTIRSGTALKNGRAVGSITGLSQGKQIVRWLSVAHFRILESDTQKRPFRGAIGAAAGAAAGALLGPVGAVAGMTAGAATFGLHRVQTAKLLLGSDGDLEFSCSASNMKVLFGWWQEHRRAV